jgi:hypothetical protein
MFNPIVLSIWVVAAVFLGLLATPALSPTVFKVVFKVKVLTRILALFLIVFGCSTLLAEHLLVLATNRLDKKDYQSTIRYAQIVHYLNPSLTQPLNLSALAMIREGAPVARVEQQIALATALESKSPYNYLTCAKLYYELYKNKKNLDFATRADSCFKKAMQISPGYPEFELQYGAFLLQTGYAPQAEAYIKRGLAGGGGEGVSQKVFVVLQTRAIDHIGRQWGPFGRARDVGLSVRGERDQAQVQRQGEPSRNTHDRPSLHDHTGFFKVGLCTAKRALGKAPGTCSGPRYLLQCSREDPE